MSTQAVVVTPVQGFIPVSETEIQIVQDSHDKLGEILEKLLADFKADVLKLAGTVTAASVPNFPIDSFVSSWTQLLERFRTRSGAIASFRLELSNVRDVFKKEHARELITAFQLKLAALKLELKARNEVDTEIEKEIAETEEIIAELEKLKSHKTTTYETAQASRKGKTTQQSAQLASLPAKPASGVSRKRARKSAANKATKRAGKRAVKK